MAQYKDIEELYAQVKQTQDLCNELEATAKDILEADDKGQVYIKIQRSGRILQVGTEDLLGIVADKKIKSDEDLDKLLKKVTIK